MNCRVAVSSEDKNIDIRRGSKKRKNHRGITEVEKLGKDHSFENWSTKKKE